MVGRLEGIMDVPHASNAPMPALQILRRLTARTVTLDPAQKPGTKKAPGTPVQSVGASDWVPGYLLGL